MRAKKILFYSTGPIILLKTHTLPLSLSLNHSIFQLSSHLSKLSQANSLNVVLRSLGRGCALVCIGIGVEIGVWFQRLGS